MGAWDLEAVRPHGYSARCGFLVLQQMVFSYIGVKDANGASYYFLLFQTHSHTLTWAHSGRGRAVFLLYHPIERHNLPC